MMAYLVALSTLLAMLTFLIIVWWAFSRERQAANHEAALLPFALPDESYPHQHGDTRP